MKNDFETIKRKQELHLEKLEIAVREEHKVFLKRLEVYAVWAIINNDWRDFHRHLVDFQEDNDLHGICGATLDDVEDDIRHREAMANLDAAFDLAFGRDFDHAQ